MLEPGAVDAEAEPVEMIASPELVCAASDGAYRAGVRPGRVYGEVIERLPVQPSEATREVLPTSAAPQGRPQ
jgi:hypothetical protein